jgi:hypothetical protein
MEAGDWKAALAANEEAAEIVIDKTYSEGDFLDGAGRRADWHGASRSCAARGLADWTGGRPGGAPGILCLSDLLWVTLPPKGCAICQATFYQNLEPTGSNTRTPTIVVVYPLSRRAVKRCTARRTKQIGEEFYEKEADLYQSHQ